MNKGFEGQITAFAVPYVAIGMTALIVDKRYGERKGYYFIDKVEGQFSKNGGRQRIHLGNYLGEVTDQQAAQVIAALPRR